MTTGSVVLHGARLTVLCGGVGGLGFPPRVGAPVRPRPSSWGCQDPQFRLGGGDRGWLWQPLPWRCRLAEQPNVTVEGTAWL